MSSTISTICVCGAGTMGSGIAQVFAMHGFEVVLYDVDVNTLKAAEEKIAAALQSLVNKQKLSDAEKSAALKNIAFTAELHHCIAGLVIEAIIEKEVVKAELFNKLISINDASTLYATNTSSLSVTAIAEKTTAPERFAGMHFFNPAPLMKLVEVVKTKYTAEETIKTLCAIAARTGKTAVVCTDSPGFIVNRVARPYYLEALYIHEKTGASIESIDLLMQSAGFRMGPFTLMDLIGNDINYSVSCIVHEALGRPERLKPSGIQQQKVNNGSLGRKTGKGYYDYPV